MINKNKEPSIAPTNNGKFEARVPGFMSIDCEPTTRYRVFNTEAEAKVWVELQLKILQSGKVFS